MEIQTKKPAINRDRGIYLSACTSVRLTANEHIHVTCYQYKVYIYIVIEANNVITVQVSISNSVQNPLMYWTRILFEIILSGWGKYYFGVTSWRVASSNHRRHCPQHEGCSYVTYSTYFHPCRCDRILDIILWVRHASWVRISLTTHVCINIKYHEIKW